MKLSIITVNLNNRDGLQKTIDSVVSQTFRDFEWIVIDGGSTDGSKELIEQYSDHFSYWVSEPDKGIYNAMNKGVRHANGDYVLFLNSGDCILEPKTLENIFLQCFEADVVYGDYAVVSGNAAPQIKRYEGQFSFATVLEYGICHQSTFICRSLLLEDPYDESLIITSDWKFLIRKVMEGRTFQHVGVIVAAFDDAGVSTNNRDLLINELKGVISEEVPECIREDYWRFMAFEKECNQWQIKSIRKFCRQGPLFHKMITLNIRIMELLQKVF